MSTVTTVAARRQFDQAIAAMGTVFGAARTLFTEATRADPAMADAWLGRIAAGDDDLATLEQLHDCGARPPGVQSPWSRTVGVDQGRTASVDHRDGGIARRDRTGQCVSR